MISYGKPLGTFEGLVFYGDDRNPNLVYYLPHEIDFAPRNNGKADLDLLIIRKGAAHSGGAADPRSTHNSILSLGVQCKENDSKVTRAVSGLCAKHNLDEKRVVVSTPPWDKGKVELVILDKDQSKADEDESMFVTSILGSSIPSLDGDLKGTFNVVLNPDGTDVLQSILKENSDKTALVLVNYDVEYTAMRPSVSIHMKANLERCQKTMRNYLDIGFEMWYYIDFDFGFQLDWLTKKMEDNGDIVIDILSPVTTPEEQEAVDELAHEFKDFVLKQLFEPVPELGQMVKVNEKSNAEIASDVVKAAGPAAKDLADAVKTVKEAATGGTKPGEDGGGASTTPGTTPPPAAGTKTPPAAGTTPSTADDTKTSTPSGNDNGPKKDDDANDGDDTLDHKDELHDDSENTQSDDTADATTGNSPTVNPKNFKLGVKYQLKYEEYSFDRNIEVTYNGSTAAVKHLNTSTHLSRVVKDSVLRPSLIGIATKPAFEDCIKEVRLGEDLLDQHVSCIFDYNFTDPDSDIKAAEVFLWRKKDVNDYLATLENKPNEPIKMEDILVPTCLEPFTRDWIFRKDKSKVNPVSWPMDGEGEAGYYYRVHYIYGGDIPNMYSWEKEYWTDPVASSSEEIVIRPYDNLTYRKISVSAGPDLDLDKVRRVTVDLKEDEKILGRVLLDKTHTNGHFIYRSNLNPELKVAKQYAFTGEDPVTLTSALVGNEIYVDTPTYLKKLQLTILGLNDSVQTLQLFTSAIPTEEGLIPKDDVIILKNEALQEVNIPVYSPTDTIDYTLIAMIGDEPVERSGRWEPSAKKIITIRLNAPDSTQS